MPSDADGVHSYPGTLIMLSAVSAVILHSTSISMAIKLTAYEGQFVGISISQNLFVVFMFIATLSHYANIADYGPGKQCEYRFEVYS
jgi:cysteine synthase